MTAFRTASVAILSPIRLLAESLAAELRRVGFTIPFAGQGSIEEAVNASAEVRDLILLYDASISTRLQDLEALVAAQRVRHLVLIGLDGSSPDLLRCAGLGAPGLLSRDASLEQLVAAVDAVSQGGVFMSPSLRDTLVRRVGVQGSGARAGTLTPRERDVAALIAGGLSNKQIANALQAREGTVKIHVRHVMGEAGGEPSGRRRSTARLFRRPSANVRE